VAGTAGPAELENLANETIGALLEIFEVTEEVRAEIISRIEGHLLRCCARKFRAS
jgi:hypothetical protein